MSIVLVLNFVHEYVVNVPDHKLVIARRGENGGHDRLSRAVVVDAEFFGSLSPKLPMSMVAGSSRTLLNRPELDYQATRTVE